MPIVRRPKKRIGREQLRELYPELYQDLIEQGHLEPDRLYSPAMKEKDKLKAEDPLKAANAVNLLVQSLKQVRKDGLRTH
jgi:hypothetical protein